MNKLILTILISLFSLTCMASETHNSYAYHSFTVLDRDFKVQHETKGNGKPVGLIIFADVDGTEYVAVTLGEDTVYEIQVVNTVNDEQVQEGTKCVIYQGGMRFQGEVVVINVLFFYDTDKNSDIPESVLIDVHNSPTIMELSGLVKIGNY